MDGPQGISTQKAYTTLTGHNVLVVAAWLLPFPSWPRCFCRLFLQMPQLLTRSAIYKQVERSIAMRGDSVKVHKTKSHTPHITWLAQPQ